MVKIDYNTCATKPAEGSVVVAMLSGALPARVRFP